MDITRRISFSLPAKIQVLLLLLGVVFSTSKATHIIGADLTYECVDDVEHIYEITLVMYRDCTPAAEADFDSPLHLFVFASNNPGGNWGTVQMFLPVGIPPEIEPTGWDSCMATPYNLCVQRGEYKVDVKLPPIPGGYDLAWARCCRNANITNLFAPLDEGITFLAHVPGPELSNCNSSPTFNNLLPTFICAGTTFSFDHSASDIDGDSLVYHLVHPYTGLNIFGVGAGNGTPGPIVAPFNNPMGPPPYQTVQYLNGAYNAQNPFGPGSFANIDLQTGFLELHPAQTGIYVVAIEVEDWRNGQLLSRTRRDFQIHALNCLPQGEPPFAYHDLTGVDTTSNGISSATYSNDTIYAIAGTNFCYITEVIDSVLTDKVISFPVSGQFGGGSFFPPAASFSIIPGTTNPVFAEICWSPACEYIGQTIPLIIGGKDQAGCINTNHAYDTVYITILPPPIVEPKVGYDLSTTNHNGDTIIVPVDSSMCFDWWVTDSLDSNQLGYKMIFQQIGGSAFSAPPTTLTRFSDSLALHTCWTAGCSNMGKLYRLTLIGDDNSFCPPDNEDRAILYIRVPSLPNPPPVVYHDSTVIFVNDTLYVDVHNTICYTFTVNDTFPSAGISYEFEIQNLSGQVLGSPKAKLNTLIDNGDSITVEVCWTPACINVNEMWMLIAKGTQDNRCNQEASNYDTVYVFVNDVINPPPVYTRNFFPQDIFIGDTLFIAADSAACYQFTLIDTVGTSYLEIDFEVQQMPGGNPSGHTVSISDSIWTLDELAGTVCFTPGCEYVNQLLRVVSAAKDTFDCTPDNFLFDTIYIQVREPDNRPPTLTRDLSGLNLLDTITISEPPIGEDYCFHFVLEDPDSLWHSLVVEGVSATFNPEFGYGNEAQLTWTGTNPLLITVCWNPSCYEQLQGFDMVVCGRDTSRCALTPVVCDSIRFEVEACSLDVANVFTPNGDGFNEVFLPFNVSGVEYYNMWIYDRWGNKISQLNNKGWDGSINGGAMANEGVYFWVVELQYWSGEGELLKERRAGNLTLLR
ncbi:MAG: gliding motility-associated C-terminal domain-containing protein [Bacteroidia bacterium]|nr:gliding motility-associated C-terminal domain-containing protein [Bacteroidia bacterium]